jgi:hypothetical protein
MRLDLGPSLAALKQQLLSRVDAAAEAARLRFITPGAGQALEYQATEREARAYVAAGSPLPFDGAAYPFLEAERQAIFDATGPLLTGAEIAAMVIANADAWAATGAEIKRLRRSAKLLIEQATTPQAARAAAQVAWPQP